MSRRCWAGSSGWNRRGRRSPPTFHRGWARGDRQQHAPRCQQLRLGVAPEPLQQRRRHAGRIHRRGDAPGQGLPKAAAGDRRAPPAPPPGERPLADVDRIEDRRPRLAPRRPVPQRRPQHDDRTEIHLPAQKAPRRRRPTPTTAVHRTTEAEPDLTGEQPAFRAPPIVGRVQGAAAGRATVGSSLVGELTVRRQQPLTNAGIRQKRMGQWDAPPCFATCKE